jgi:LPXTG-site transpeptidase (sortase) family protein
MKKVIFFTFLLLLVYSIFKIVNIYRPSYKPILNYNHNNHEQLFIPCIGIDTKLGFAKNINGIIDSKALLGKPAIIENKISDNVLILGHRQWYGTPLIFANLDKIPTGVSIYLFNIPYHVTYQREINPSEIWNIVLKEQDALILVTCAPYGHNYHRLVVVAHKGGILHGSSNCDTCP